MRAAPLSFTNDIAVSRRTPLCTPLGYTGPHAMRCTRWAHMLEVGEGGPLRLGCGAGGPLAPALHLSDFDLDLD
jgi:hypothetical protein